MINAIHSRSTRLTDALSRVEEPVTELTTPDDRCRNQWPTALSARLFAALALASFTGCSDDASSKTMPEQEESDGGGSTAPRFTCTGKMGSKGEHVLNVATVDGPRTAYLHVPETYDPSVGAMLVFGFHALGRSAQLAKAVSGMDALSDSRGFLMVNPEGLLGSGADSDLQAWNAGICCGEHDDKAFVRAMIESMSKDFCIDPKRVYSTGMSMGGMFSYRLACELSDTIAAIAPVGAGMLVQPITDCHPSRPVPVLHIHGTNDPAVPYSGGLDGAGHGFDWPPVAEEMALWQNLNGCTGESETVYAQGDARCEEWSACKQGSHVQLCTIEGGGHTYPGLPPALFPAEFGKVSADLAASEWIISFFERHPMP
jgi:polyhydroxybutyrate depolymerase